MSHLNKLPSDVFFNYIVYYLPFNKSRGVCKLPSNIYHTIEQNALNNMRKKVHSFKSNDERLDYLLKQKFLLTLSNPMIHTISLLNTIIYQIKCESKYGTSSTSNILSKSSDYYINMFFNVNREEMFYQIKKDLSNKSCLYYNSLSDQDIIKYFNELSQHITTSNLKFIQY